MPNFHFDDVLRTTNSHLDVNHWAPPSTKWDTLTASFKAAPAKGLSVAHTRSNSQEWDSAKSAFKLSEKNATTITKAKDGNKYSFAVASDAFKQGFSGNLMNDDWKVDGAVALEEKPAKKEWKGKATVSIVSPVLAEKMRLWVNAELEHNQASEWTTLAKCNVSYDQWHVGAAAEIKKGEVEKKHVQVAFNDKEAQYFARADLKAESAGIGCSIEHEKFTHSYEATFSWAKNASGFMGSPISVVGGGDYDLSKATSLGYTWTLGSGYAYNQSTSHKLNDNWTVAANQAFDSERLSTKQPAYDVGFGVTYTL